MWKMGKIWCNLIIMLVFVISVSSCRNLSDKNIGQETIFLKMHPGDLPDDSKLSDVVKGVRLIPLETAPECYINAIVRIFVGDKHILVLSPGSMQYLYLFTMEGKFVRKIGKPGKGPEEYTGIRDISVFEDQQKVYLSSGLSGEQVVYNFDGSFDRRIKGITGAAESKRISNNHTAYFTYLDYEVKILDETTGNIVGFILIDPEYQASIASFSGSQHHGFFIQARGKDTIWTFNHDSLIPALVFDFGTGSIRPREYFRNRSQGGLPDGKIAVESFTFRGSGYYHFLLEHQNKLGKYNGYDVLVNENTLQTWHIPFRSESDDILFSDAVFLKNSSKTGDFITSAHAYELIEALPKIKANDDFDYDEVLIRQIEGMKEDDNPVLVLYTLK